MLLMHDKHGVMFCEMGKGTMDGGESYILSYHNTEDDMYELDKPWGGRVLSGNSLDRISAFGADGGAVTSSLRLGGSFILHFWFKRPKQLL